jgi:hypothetical protein
MCDHDNDVQYERLSVNINDETAKILRNLKLKKGFTITEAVRRAVALYDLLDQEVARGGKAQLVDRNGRNARDIIFLR